MREGDVQFLEDKNSGDSSQTGLRVTFGAKAGRENVGTSSEDVSNIHVSPSSEQLSFMQKGRPPPREFALMGVVGLGVGHVGWVWLNALIV